MAVAVVVAAEEVTTKDRMGKGAAAVQRRGGRRRYHRDGGYGGGGGGSGGGYQNRDRGQFGGDLAPQPLEDGSMPPPIEGQEGMPPQQQYDGAPPAVETPLEAGSGVLEMHPNGYGFLRNPENNFTRERTDPFVPGTMIEKFGLREGRADQRHGAAASPQQGPRLQEILDVDGMAPEDYAKVKTFDELTPINPEEWLRLETGAAAARPRG